MVDGVGPPEIDGISRFGKVGMAEPPGMGGAVRPLDVDGVASALEVVCAGGPVGGGGGEHAPIRAFRAAAFAAAFAAATRSLAFLLCSFRLIVVRICSAIPTAIGVIVTRPMRVLYWAIRLCGNSRSFLTLKRKVETTQKYIFLVHFPL